MSKANDGILASRLINQSDPSALQPRHRSQLGAQLVSNESICSGHALQAADCMRSKHSGGSIVSRRRFTVYLLLLISFQPNRNSRSSHDGQPTKPISPKTKRAKQRRMHGADLYVARFGRDAFRSRCDTLQSDEIESVSNPSPCSSLSDDQKSLHDELTIPHYNRGELSVGGYCMQSQQHLDAAIVRESHPCYRCVEFMVAAGIKRVFWTEDGSFKWRSAKVNDLGAALHIINNRNGRGATDNERVFMTKHELLLSRCPADISPSE